MGRGRRPRRFGGPILEGVATPEAGRTAARNGPVPYIGFAARRRPDVTPRAQRPASSSTGEEAPCWDFTAARARASTIGGTGAWRGGGGDARRSSTAMSMSMSATARSGATVPPARRWCRRGAGDFAALGDLETLGLRGSAGRRRRRPPASARSLDIHCSQRTHGLEAARAASSASAAEIRGVVTEPAAGCVE